MMKCSLENIKVIDLSRVLAGPSCTQILGDLGAEIIKIEKPYAGDDTRYWGPPYMTDGNGNDTSESAYYLSANRNKKSVAIDIKTADGQELIHKLLQKSDVMVHNFKVGGLEKYGLGYAQIKARHPHIIYCAISGFGQNGSLASESGYDFVAQAMGGLMACTGGAGTEPMKVGVALSDYITGLYAVIGILSALRARDESGRGQMVDLSLLDCTLSSMVNIAQYYLTSGENPPRLGNAHSTIVPYQAFKASDDFVILAIGNDGQFKRFCDLVGKLKWAGDQKFQTNNARVTNRDELVTMIGDIMAQKTVTQWVSLCRDSDIPCGPVNTIDQVFDLDQIKARDMKITMDHDLTDMPVDLVGSPLKLSDTPVKYDKAPPYLGQHTREVLADILQMEGDEITSLDKNGIVQISTLKD